MPRPRAPAPVETWSVVSTGAPETLTVAEITARIRAGTMPTNAQVWKHGRKSWMPLLEDTELVPLIGPRSAAPAMSDAMGEEEEATKLDTRHLADALSDGDDEEATKMFTAAHAEEMDEATKMFVPASSPSAGGEYRPTIDSLRDAVGDDDDEATKMVDAYGARERSAERDRITDVTGRPSAMVRRAESTVPVLPPRSSPSPQDDWQESSVVVKPDELTGPDESTGPTGPGRSKRHAQTMKGRRRADIPVLPPKVVAPGPARSASPVTTAVFAAVLALAAAIAGFLFAKSDAEPARIGSVPAATIVATAPATSEPAPVPPPVDETAPAPAEEGGDGRLEPTPKRAEGSKSKGTKAPRAVVPTPQAESPAPLEPVLEPVAEPAPEPEEPPKPPLDTARAKAAMLGAAGDSERGCSKPGEPNGAGIVSLTLLPSGKAVGVALRGPLTGTSTGLCILKRFGRVSVPPFSGSATPMDQKVMIP